MQYINADFFDYDSHQNSDFDCADDFGTKFTSYLQGSSIHSKRQVNNAL